MKLLLEEIPAKFMEMLVYLGETLKISLYELLQGSLEEFLPESLKVIRRESLKEFLNVFWMNLRNSCWSFTS